MAKAKLSDKEKRKLRYDDMELNCSPKAKQIGAAVPYHLQAAKAEKKKK